MTKLRVRDLDPETVATDAYVIHCVDTVRRCEAAGFPVVSLDFEALKPHARVYQAVYCIAEYAKGAPWPVGIPGEIRELEALIDRGDLYQAEPTTPLAMVVAAALARCRLEDAEHLSVLDLAALTGLDRDHIGRLASQGAVPGAYRSTVNGHKPWMFRPNKSLRAWIAAYQTTETQADRSPRHGTSRP